MLKGSCLCQSVKFEISETPEKAFACHCNECRNMSGHHFAVARTKNTALHFVRDDGLALYQSSAFAERGFCKVCGSSIFWRSKDGDVTNVLLGAIDGPTGLALSMHFHVAEKGDYYEITDGVPQLEAE